MITSDLYLIIRFNRINLNVPVFNISNADLGTTEEKEVTDYHFDIVTSFLFVGTLTELLGNISVDSW